MDIAAKAKKVMSKTGSRDPFEIADGLHINVMMRDFVSLKGMYTVIKRNRYIFLNQNLDEQTMRLVCAHEIGHDTLHRELAKGISLQEFSLLDLSCRPEYEANAFAAHILLSDDDILSLAEEGYTVWEIAVLKQTAANLVLIKMMEMNKTGYHFELPYLPQGNFLQ